MCPGAPPTARPPQMLHRLALGRASSQARPSLPLAPGLSGCHSFLTPPGLLARQLAALPLQGGSAHDRLCGAGSRMHTSPR